MHVLSCILRGSPGPPLSLIPHPFTYDLTLLTCALSPHPVPRTLCWLQIQFSSAGPVADGGMGPGGEGEAMVRQLAATRLGVDEKLER